MKSFLITEYHVHVIVSNCAFATGKETIEMVNTTTMYSKVKIHTSQIIIIVNTTTL